MDADGLRRPGRHFGEEVSGQRLLGPWPGGDFASHLRPSASIRGLLALSFHLSAAPKPTGFAMPLAEPACRSPHRRRSLSWARRECKRPFSRCTSGFALVLGAGAESEMSTPNMNTASAPAPS